LQIFFRSYRSIDFARHKFITYLQVKHMCQFEDFTRARGTTTTLAGRLQCAVLLETLSQSPLWPSINPSIFLSRLKTHRTFVPHTLLVPHGPGLGPDLL